MPLILPGNVGSATAATGYDVANSCIFNDGDSPDIRRTFGSAGDLDKWTFSCWYKRSSHGSATQRLFGAGSNNTTIYFSSSDQLAFYDAALDTGWDVQNTDHRKFRDLSAWYHIVWTLDSAQGTAANRVKCYINGVQQTLTKSGSGGDQNFTTAINTAVAHFIGKRPTHDTGYLDGYLAEVCFNDGQAYAASNYGEFDEDSPQIWKPKDVSGLTFGTNGFYLDFEDSGTLGNDANGGTDWTATNLAATDQSTDTCTNNFCTINGLDNYHAGNTLSEGNLKIVSAGGGAGWDGSNTGTMGVSAGKWYWELFADTDANVEIYGIKSGVSHTDSNYVTETTALGELGYGIVTTSGNMGYPDGQSESYGSAIDADDKLMFALDMDNLRFYFGVNGTWANSGDPAGNSNGYTISAPPSGFYFPAVSFYVSETIYLNFGSPPTGFTISSGNADDNGYGNFEYDVPAGFYSICTKNLGEFGG